jgi:DNA-binding MarR family transcriptional regulator
MKRGSLTPTEFQSLAEIRHQIRKYLHVGEIAARKAGLEPRQHQMLLAIHGLPPGLRPTVGEMAARLQIEHHSAVELVNRLAASGYVRRARETGDKREVLLAVTTKGSRALALLTELHFWELSEGGQQLGSSIRKALRPALQRSASGQADRVSLRGLFRDRN